MQTWVYGCVLVLATQLEVLQEVLGSSQHGRACHGHGRRFLQCHDCFLQLLPQLPAAFPLRHIMFGNRRLRVTLTAAPAGWEGGMQVLALVVPRRPNQGGCCYLTQARTPLRTILLIYEIKVL